MERHNEEEDGGTTSKEEIEAAMRELREASHLTLANVLKRLRFEEEDVVAVFLVGSRLWGSATFDSDYDFIIVHRCPTAKRPPHATLHNGEIDASAVHVDEFKKRVEDDHSFYELLCLWLPADYRWKDAPLPSSSSSSSSSKSSAKKKGSPAPSSTSSSSSKPQTSFVESTRRSFVLNPSRLYASIEEETARDWRVAQKFMEKGSPDRGKKILVHALRLLLLAIQLARDGTMHDLHAAQRFHHDIFFKTNKTTEDLEESWGRCSARYRPVFDDLRRQLQDLCTTKARPQPQPQPPQQQALRHEEKKDEEARVEAQPRTLTPAAIAGRIKAKGLEKLRWYCQLCGEQFPDESGFKRHITTASHQRQLASFTGQPRVAKEEEKEEGDDQAEEEAAAAAAEEKKPGKPQQAGRGKQQRGRGRGRGRGGSPREKEP